MRDPRTPRRRLVVLLVLVALWAVVIVGRLVQVQVLDASSFQELARRQQSSVVEVAPVRGAILDRHGVELALSRDVRSIYAVPGLVADPEAAATALARALGRKRGPLLHRLRQTDRYFVWIARRVPDAQAEAVAALALPGIGFRDEPKRFYPHGSLAAHVLGYTGLDEVGLAGVEQRFDAEIAGIPGVELTLKDARGLRFLPEPGGLPAEPGPDLVLSLDASIQHVLERELEDAWRSHRAKGAVGVVLDPWTGDVLAMAARPTFDPNRYARAPAAARRNPAVEDAYEPGSTFKVVTFTAALEGGRVDPGEPIDCGRGSITIAGQCIRDHDSYDVLSAAEVLMHSSNVGAIVIGSRLPPEDFHRQMHRFGFGRPTGIDLPGESPGLLRRTRDWSKISRASISIGQEVAVTPIQLASAFAAIANGGSLVRPRIALRLQQPDGRMMREAATAPARRVMRPDIARTLLAMMEGVVQDGTGKAAAIDGVRVAGKTGTAQKVIGGTYASGRYVASFAGFAPAEEPRAVVLIAIDEPLTGVYYGGLVAAPVVKRVLEPTLARLGVAAEGRVVEVRLDDHYPEAGGNATPPVEDGAVGGGIALARR